MRVLSFEEGIAVSIVSMGRKTWFSLDPMVPKTCAIMAKLVGKTIVKWRDGLLCMACNARISHQSGFAASNDLSASGSTWLSQLE
jgi:hypothetical protein